MKTSFFVLILLAALGPRVIAADSAADAAAAAAGRREAEEKYRSISTTVEQLLESQEVLRKRIGALGDEILKVREQSARASGGLVTREEFKKFVDKLQEEIDRKREEDKKLILEALEDIRKSMRAAAAPAPGPRGPTTEPGGEGPEQFYEYTIKPGNVLSAIVQAFNEDAKAKGKPAVTVAQVLKANPKLNEKRLIPGQKIKIPVLDAK